MEKEAMRTIVFFLIALIAIAALIALLYLYADKIINVIIT